MGVDGDVDIDVGVDVGVVWRKNDQFTWLFSWWVDGENVGNQINKWVLLFFSFFTIYLFFNSKKLAVQ